MTKKNDYRFSINLNPNDPMHKMAINELNKQGRRKTQFIVNAIVQYLTDGGDSSRCNTQPDKEYIEEICRSLITEYVTENKITQPLKPIKQISARETEADDNLDSAMISDMMNNFRSK